MGAVTLGRHADPSCGHLPRQGAAWQIGKAGYPPAACSGGVPGTLSAAVVTMPADPPARAPTPFRDEASRVPRHFTRESSTHLRRPRALLVDDERDSLDLYEEALCRAGWDVSIAVAGDEALLVAPVSPPDVIVLDLAMPVLDGFQTMQRLKLDPRTTRIPIVVLTGLMTRSNMRRAMRTGAELVLPKPCPAIDLQSALESIVTSRQRGLRGPAPGGGVQSGG
jgi:CheY-like chemotaxis protein